MSIVRRQFLNALVRYEQTESQSERDKEKTVEKRPDLLDELVTERKRQLDLESAKLEDESTQIAQMTKILAGESPDRII